MNFSFIQITDHHIPEAETDLLLGFSTVYALRMVLRRIAENAAHGADFIVSTGDLVDTSSEPAYRTFAGLLGLRANNAQAPGPLGMSLDGLHDMPFYCLPGNHDDRSNFFRGLFPAHPARALLNATFNHKGVQFICLDWGPDTKAQAHRETLDFLAGALRADPPSIILMHHHLSPVGSRWLDAFIADEAGLFWQAIAGQRVLGVFCGHAHTSYEKTVAGIPVFGLRSTSTPFVLQDEPLACLLPPHYRLVSLRDGVLSSEIFEVPL